MTTPRIRTELRATPTDDAGVTYFDVRDPQSGVSMRLYDFEWLLAAQMDGRRSLDEIARWAQGALGLDISSTSLSEYAKRLGELGFFAADAQGAQADIEPPDSDDLSLDLSVEDAVTQQHEALPTRAPVSVSTPEEQTVPRLDPMRGESARAPSVEPAARVEGAPRIDSARPPADDRDTPTQVNTLAADRAPADSSTDRLSREGLPAAQPKKGSGSAIGLVVVVLAIAGVVGYVKFYAPSSAKVTIEVVASREVARWHDGVGKLEKATAHSLSFGESGKVIDVVAVGTEVKEKMPLATLEAYTKVEKEVADVKDRLGFYQKQLEAAGAKGDTEAQKSAEGKVTEKRKLLGELEARAVKLRLVAPGPGVVDKVHVTAGAEAKSGEPAIELTGKGMAAKFKLAAAAAAEMKVGDTASMQASADAKPVDGKISRIESGEVTIEVPEDAALKAGGEVHLVKARLVNVVVVPASAVAKKGAVDTVFVLENGELHQKTITVAERSASDVYVSAGLTSGQSVVTSAVEGLTDGQKASSAP